MLTIGSVVLGVADVPRAVTFWTRALDYVPREEPEDDWAVLVPAQGRQGTQLSLTSSETPVQRRPRIHLDLYAGDAQAQAAEVSRLLTLGAHRADWDDYPPDADFVVLTDPDDNAFCVINTARP